MTRPSSKTKSTIVELPSNSTKEEDDSQRFVPPPSDEVYVCDGECIIASAEPPPPEKKKENVDDPVLGNMGGVARAGQLPQELEIVLEDRVVQSVEGGTIKPRVEQPARVDLKKEKKTVLLDHAVLSDTRGSDVAEVERRILDLKREKETVVLDRAKRARNKKQHEKFEHDARLSDMEFVNENPTSLKDFCQKLQEINEKCTTPDHNLELQRRLLISHPFVRELRLMREGVYPSKPTVIAKRLFSILNRLICQHPGFENFCLADQNPFIRGTKSNYTEPFIGSIEANPQILGVNPNSGTLFADGNVLISEKATRDTRPHRNAILPLPEHSLLSFVTQDSLSKIAREHGPYEPSDEAEQDFGFGLFDPNPNKYIEGEPLPNLLREREHRPDELKCLEQPDNPYCWIGTVWFICLSAWRAESRKKVVDETDFYFKCNSILSKMQGSVVNGELEKFSFSDFFEVCFRRCGLYASFVAYCVMHVFKLQRGPTSCSKTRLTQHQVFIARVSHVIGKSMTRLHKSSIWKKKLFYVNINPEYLVVTKKQRKQVKLVMEYYQSISYIDIPFSSGGSDQEESEEGESEEGEDRSS